MSTDPTGQPTEDELRAAYEAEIKKIRVEQMLLENIVTLVNLGMRRTGLAPGTEDERDQTQVRIAIEAVRALLPLVEQAAPSQANAIRDAVSQLQLAYVRIGGQPPAPDQPPGEQGGTPPAGGSGAAGAPGDAGGSGTPGGAGGSGTPPGEPAPEPPTPGEPGPAQRSGRLWVPGQ
jgi:hypothetical protein